MSNLNRYITEQQETINNCLETIQDLQQQLNELNQRLRVEQLLCRARETAEKEVNDWLKHGKKLMKDLCSVFPAEALQDLADEVKIMAEEVAQEYDQHAHSGRFLNPVDDNTTVSSEAKGLIMVIEQLPDENDDTTLLTASQIETVLSSYDSKVIQTLRKQWGVHGRVKSLAAITKKLAELKVLTHLKLKNAISDAQRESQRQLLLQSSHVNGKSENGTVIIS